MTVMMMNQKMNNFNNLNNQVYKLNGELSIPPSPFEKYFRCALWKFNNTLSYNFNLMVTTCGRTEFIGIAFRFYPSMINLCQPIIYLVALYTFYNYKIYWNWVFATNPNFLILIYLQSDAVNLWSFKLGLFQLTEFILVWNNWVAK